MISSFLTPCPLASIEAGGSIRDADAAVGDAEVIRGQGAFMGWLGAASSLTKSC